MLSTSFETAEELVQPLTLSAKITTNNADGVTAKYAQAGATFETTAGAMIHYVLTDTLVEDVTIEKAKWYDCRFTSYTRRNCRRSLFIYRFSF